MFSDSRLRAGRPVALRDEYPARGTHVNKNTPPYSGFLRTYGAQPCRSRRRYHDIGGSVSRTPYSSTESSPCHSNLTLKCTCDEAQLGHPPTPARAHPMPRPHPHRAWPHASHIRTGTGLATATSAPGLGTPPPHLHRDWAHPRHICTGTGHTPLTSAPRLASPLPHLH